MARIQGVREERPLFLYDTITIEPGQRRNLFGLKQSDRIGSFDLTNVQVDGMAASDQDFYVREIVTERLSGSTLAAKSVLLTLMIGDRHQLQWFAGAPSFPDGASKGLDEFTSIVWARPVIPKRQNFHVTAESSASETVRLRVTLRGLSIWREE